MASILEEKYPRINLHPGDAVVISTNPNIDTEKLLQSQQTNSKKFTIIIYPTVKPETIIVPIVSCIVCFPVLALLVICCLKRRAKLSRERARRRNCELDRGDLSRLSPSKRGSTVSFSRSSRGRPSLDLDTVMEERSDAEFTTIEMMTPDKDGQLMMTQLMALQEIKNGGEVS